MKSHKFTKMQGAGNDFVVFDRKINENLELSAQQVSRICDRHFGVGANGVLVISDTNDADFRVEYFETDGATGNLCANGARCMIRYASYSKRLNGCKARFIFNTGQYSGEVIDEEYVKFNLNPPVTEKYNFEIEAAGHKIKASYINNGTPHLIIMINDVLKDVSDPGSGYNYINDFPFLKIAKELREYSAFDPAGANVNFYTIKDDVVYIRTFERGVEGETLACGTGVAAAAIVINKINNLKPPVKFITKGGDLLSVHFSVANKLVNDLSLIGKAEVVFTGELFNLILIEDSKWVKLFFSIRYEIISDKREEYLDVIRELKTLVDAEGLESYSAYEQRNKKNYFEEVYIFGSKQAYEDFDDNENERVDILMTKLSDMIKQQSTTYSTLFEV